MGRAPWGGAPGCRARVSLRGWPPQTGRTVVLLGGAPGCRARVSLRDVEGFHPRADLALGAPGCRARVSLRDPVRALPGGMDAEGAPGCRARVSLRDHPVGGHPHGRDAGALRAAGRGCRCGVLVVNRLPSMPALRAAGRGCRCGWLTPPFAENSALRAAGRGCRCGTTVRRPRSAGCLGAPGCRARVLLRELRPRRGRTGWEHGAPGCRARVSLRGRVFAQALRSAAALRASGRGPVAGAPGFRARVSLLRGAGVAAGCRLTLSTGGADD